MKLYNNKSIERYTTHIKTHVTIGVRLVINGYTYDNYDMIKTQEYSMMSVVEVYNVQCDMFDVMSCDILSQYTSIDIKPL